MALKKFHLAPWIQWYPWTERASKPPKSMLIPKLNGYSDGSKQVPCSTTDTMVSMNWTRFQTTKNLHSYQNLTVIQMALKKLHLAPWIQWYPWTERASKPPKSTLIPKLNGYSDGSKKAPSSAMDMVVSLNWTRVSRPIIMGCQRHTFPNHHHQWRNRARLWWKLTLNLWQ